MTLSKQALQRNIFAYYMGKVSWLALMITGVVQLWQVSGMDFAKILLLQGLFGFFVLVVEFPSGILADITKRKYVMVFAHLTVMLGSLIYSVSNEFYQFVLAEAVYGLGMASISGTDTALVWDSFVERDDEQGAEKTIATGRSIMTGSAVICMVAGGYLAVINLRLPFILAGLGSLLSALSYVMSTEAIRTKVESSRVALGKSLRLLGNVKFIEAVSLLLITTVALRTAFWAYIPKMQEVNLDAQWFGYVLAGANLVALTATMYVRKYNHTNLRKIVMVLVIGFAGLYLFALQTSLVLILVAIAMHQVVRGIFGVVSSVKVNRIAESEIRASAGSLMSTIASGIYLLNTTVFDAFQLSLYQALGWNVAIFVIFAGIVLYANLDEVKIAFRSKNMFVSKH